MIPAAVDKRVQYLSPEWLEQVREFLTNKTPQGTFSICESYDSAPPGINGAFWIHIANGVVEVGEGVREDTQIMIEGHYPAALELAQTVFAAGDKAYGRALREVSHRWGNTFARISRGSADNLPPEIHQLHDHMAARTLPGNVDYRLQALGLENHVIELQEKGYTIIERAISEAFADELREVTQREVLTHSNLTTNGLATRHRLFEELLLNPSMNAVSQAVLGQTMINGALAGSYKEAGPGAISVHADAFYVHEPLPEWPMAAVSCWALEDWTESAGPTWVIPGSHKKRRRPRSKDSLDGAIPMIMPKGSMAIWLDGVWHWQGDRSDAGARVALHVTNNRVFARQLDKIDITDEILERNPPAFSTLMGLDDPFGRSSYTGHDMKRLAHMMQANG